MYELTFLNNFFILIKKVKKCIDKISGKGVWAECYD